jgi:hypothetical protein
MGRIVATLTVLALMAPATPAVLAQAGSSRIIELEEEVVEGRIEKPEAFYILQPTNLNYEEAAIEDTFLPELYRSVQHEPF